MFDISDISYCRIKPRVVLASIVPSLPVIWHPSYDARYPMSDVQYPISDVQYPSYDARYPISDVQYPISDVSQVSQGRLHQRLSQGLVFSRSRFPKTKCRRKWDQSASGVPLLLIIPLSCSRFGLLPGTGDEERSIQRRVDTFLHNQS